MRITWHAAALLGPAGLLVADRRAGLDALSAAASQLGTMLTLLPAVFLLLGLLDAWVDRDRVTRLLGERAGARGAVVALALGSLAAGPVYAAFPAAAVLLGKGSTLVNALVFVGAWSTTKLPLLLFESSAMGWQLTLGRLAIDVPGVIAIAWLTARIAARGGRVPGPSGTAPAPP
jgi:uncharacterized membrane protein YraQ (UPF0718 family)